MRSVLVAYVPVVHRGYIELFRRYAGAELYILGESILKDFSHIVRDMRAVAPEEAQEMVRSLDLLGRVAVIEADCLSKLLLGSLSFSMPDEEISRAVAKKFFASQPVMFEQVFLRWDKAAMARVSKINPDHEISLEKFHRDVLLEAYQESKESSDWWRQVGAVALRDGQMLFTGHNVHMPSEHTPYMVGDPRSSFEAGERIDLSSALHGEVAIIAQAAKRGVSLCGADLYITTFPCTGCARAVAKAGFARVFYAEGYSQIEGEETLRCANIKIVRVDMAQPPA